jgi:LCP family protein required for cell wall assembly
VDDDGFGPPLSGGGRAGTATRSRTGAVDEGFGPVSGGRAPRVQVSRGRRVGRTLLVALLVLVLVVVGAGVALALLANARLNRVEVRGLGEARPMNILVVGSDSREELSRSQRQALGTGSAAGARSDTILLLQVSGGQAAMLSFPRDLLVTRCDGTSGRINAAYAQGRSCLVETVTAASGIAITHYLEIDFLGFRDIVSAVGGVEMCLDKPISDADAHIDLPAGCQRLSGKDALGFVRVRKIDDDLGRIGRQQKFLSELAAEAAKPSTLLNPVKMVRTTTAVAAALTVDDNFGPLDLARLGWAARDIAGGDYPSLAVPAEPTFSGGASVLQATAEAEAVYQSFRNGSITKLGRQITPADVSVSVRNGADVPGLASTAADALRRAGFKITDVGNARHVQRTVIRYRAGNEAEAETLAAAMPRDVPLEKVPSGPSVTLILGQDAELP